SRHTLKWTKTCRSSGDFPHAHTAHFLLNRHTKAQLAQWGVPWPPSKGWRQKLVREWKEQQAYTPELSKFRKPMPVPDGMVQGDLF
ncbi:hypothetical protein, partial [Bifidobacterium breve]|uniref:hypothetical protein n=1 Tax=Bifidobacterium breve TaxID=1685 RepID=UPI00115FCEBF